MLLKLERDCIVYIILSNRGFLLHNSVHIVGFLEYIFQNSHIKVLSKMKFCFFSFFSLDVILKLRTSNLHANLDVKLSFMYQNWSSKLHQLPLDQGVQIVIPPRSPASVPEPIRMPSEGILDLSQNLKF